MLVGDVEIFGGARRGEDVKAPFPYFGGKSRVADVVWERFGDVRNYVEPFFGSGAVLLNRPQPFSGVETVNDIDGLLTNFWRACKADPKGLAELASHPPSEIDLTARHNWVFARKAEIVKMQEDPDYYDLKAAAFWVYARCTMIGTRGAFDERKGSSLPVLKSGGQGVHRWSNRDVASYLSELSRRLRDVRICCGDWMRVLGHTPLRQAGRPTAIFLDPPYQDGEFDVGVYEHSVGGGVLQEVCAWCLANGSAPDLRIALCGYDGLEMPSDWEEYAWQTSGGMGNIVKTGGERGKANAKRERIWFSPHCLSDNQARLF